MKVVSASIIFLSGAIMFSAGGLTGHTDTQAFVMLVGGAVMLASGFLWWTLLSRKSD